MSDYTCEACGMTYRGSSGHECPGTDRERIESLEDQCLQLDRDLHRAEQDHKTLLRALIAFAVSRDFDQLKTMLGEIQE